MYESRMSLTYESNSFPLLHLEADVVEQLPVPVAVREPHNLQHPLPHALGVGEGEAAPLGHKGLGHQVALGLDGFQRLLGRRGAP